jgi:two-component system nitrate/nitrite sensor histidine kinase NarX
LLLLTNSAVRVRLAVVLLAVGFAILFAYFVRAYATHAYVLRQEQTQQLAQVALNLLGVLLEEQRESSLSTDSGRRIAADLIRRMTDTHGTVLFMATYSGTLLAFPQDASQEGQSAWNTRDSAGRYFARDMTAAATGPEGGGFVEYLYPVTSASENRLAYVAAIPQWHVYIGAETSMADVDADIRTYTLNALGFAVILLFGTLAVIFVALRSTYASYRYLSRAFDQVSREPDRAPSVPVEQFATGSEAWHLLERFRQMLEEVERSKQHLRETREQFDLAIQGSNDGIWDWNLETGTAYYSPRCAEILGMGPDAQPTTFADWHNRIHPDDLKRAQVVLQGHVEGLTAFFVLEHRLRQWDGTYRWVLARGTSRRDEAGKATRISGSMTDITARKEAEEILRERETQYRSIFEVSSEGIVIVDLEQQRIVEANLAACRLFGYPYAAFIGLPVEALIPSDQRLPVTDFLGAIGEGRVLRAQRVDMRRSGADMNLELSGAPITYQRIPSALIIIHDITEQVQTFQLLEQRVQERTHEIATLLEISQSVALTVELVPLLDLILEKLKVVIDYAAASIHHIEDDSLVLLRYRGPAPQERLVLRRQIDEAGESRRRVLETRQPVIVTDVRADTPEAQAMRRHLGLRLDAEFGYFRAWLGVPLMVKDTLIGLLGLEHSQPGFYQPEHARLAVAFANQAAIFIENAQLYEKARELAALQERQRLARELHDAVTQSLFSASLIADVVPRLWERNPDEARRRTEELRMLTRGALAEMRTLLMELRPAALIETRLPELLRHLTEGASGRRRIPVKLEIEGADLGEDWQVPPDVQVALYRIAQEALNNMMKHAQATEAQVRLSVAPEGIGLHISDDGRGFDPGAVAPEHLGLRIMRERAQAIGAVLEIVSAPARGTTLSVRWLTGQGMNTHERR